MRIHVLPTRLRPLARVLALLGIGVVVLWVFALAVRPYADRVYFERFYVLTPSFHEALYDLGAIPACPLDEGRLVCDDLGVAIGSSALETALDEKLLAKEEGVERRWFKVYADVLSLEASFEIVESLRRAGILPKRLVLGFLPGADTFRPAFVLQWGPTTVALSRRLVGPDPLARMAVSLRIEYLKTLLSLRPLWLRYAAPMSKGRALSKEERPELVAPIRFINQDPIDLFKAESVRELPKVRGERYRRMLRELAAAGVQVTIVRMPERSETAALSEKYSDRWFFSELEESFARREATFLRMPKQLPDKMFYDAHHLAPNGRTAFTLHLAEHLRSYR